MSAEFPRNFTPAAESAPVPAGQRIDAWRALWIVTACVAGFLLFRDILNTGGHGMWSIAGDALWGRDFVNVHTSGTLALQGRLDILYDVDAYRAAQLELFDGGLRFHNYSYPPVTLLYTWLFALLPYPVAWLGWLAGTGALFAFAARPYLRDAGLPGWIAVLAPAAIVNIWAGHYGFLVGALWLFAWHHLPRRPVLAGVLIGLIVVKPHLALLAPLVLLWRREWIAFLAAGVTALALVGLSILLFGMELWVTYLTSTAGFQAGMVDDVGAFYVVMMPTVAPSLALAGVPTAFSLAIQAVVAVTAIALLLRHMPSDSGEAGLATALATFLVLPYAFSYDMTVASIAGLILLRRAMRSESPLLELIAWLAAAMPVLMIFLNSAGVPVTPLFVAFQLVAILGLIPRMKPA
jgi:alpha-1,2-mannosyltransferase